VIDMNVKRDNKFRQPAKPASVPIRAAHIEQVMTCTDELVELALQANWGGVLDGIEARRRLLQTIVDREAVMNPQLSALSAAVSESERALMRVVAHAIASSRLQGAQFAMYH
jgi:hypothetical protein